MSFRYLLPNRFPQVAHDQAPKMAILNQCKLKLCFKCTFIVILLHCQRRARRSVNDPLMHEQTPPQLEQLPAAGADEPGVVVRGFEVRGVFGAAGEGLPARAAGEF